MTDEKLREIFDIHFEYDGEGACCLYYDGLKRVISDYEAEKAKGTCKWSRGSQHFKSECGAYWGYWHLEGLTYCFKCGKPIEVVK